MLTGVLMRVVIVRRLLAYAVGAVYAIPVLFYILVSLIKTRGKILRSKPRDKKPECLEDPAYGEHKLASLQDVTLHYVESGQAGNPLMMMVHGFPECWYSWRHQIQEFQQQYKVIAIDQRGYYPSSSPTGAHNYTVDKLVQDVKQLIIYLGYERCTLVGHDWGGETCWGVAAKYPDLVERLIILNAPHPNTFLPHLTSTLSQFRKSWYMFLFQLPYLPEILYSLGDMGMLDRVFLGRRGGVRSGKMTKADVEAYKYLFANGSFTGPLNYIRALTRVRDVITGPSQVTCPTLMLWGDCDQFLDSGFIQLTKPYVSNLQIHLIEDASHWVQMDQPEIVNLHIREFLKST